MGDLLSRSVALICAAVALCGGCSRQPPPQAQAPLPVVVSAKAPVPARQEVRLLRADGAVERQVLQGWVQTVAGEVIPGDSVVRSGEGEAVLEVALGAEVTLAPHGELLVKEPEGAAGERGKVVLRVGQATGSASGGGGLTIGVEGSDAEAALSEGRVSVLRSDSGSVAATALEGTAQLTAGGQSVLLSKGEVSRVQGTSGRPSRPEPLPAEFLLKVKLPKMDPKKPLHRPTLAVVGSTSTGAARVMVNGVPVVVGEGGEFSASVALVQGENQVKVTAVDVAGRTTHWASTRFSADPSRPPIDAKKVDPWR